MTFYGPPAWAHVPWGLRGLFGQGPRRPLHVWPPVKSANAHRCDDDHVTPALKQLHWLPVASRVKFKLCLLMHLIHTSRAPQYLVDCVQPVTISCSRRNWSFLKQPTTSNEALERSSESVALAILAQQHRTVYRLNFEIITNTNTFKGLDT